MWAETCFYQSCLQYCPRETCSPESELALRCSGCTLTRANASCDAAQVIEDLNEECGKHGAIMRVHVPRPPNPEQSASLMGVNNYGKVCSKLTSGRNRRLPKL